MRGCGGECVEGTTLSAPSSCLPGPFSAQRGTLSSLGFSPCWQSHPRVTTKTKAPIKPFLLSFRGSLVPALSHSFTPLQKREAEIRSGLASLPSGCQRRRQRFACSRAALLSGGDQRQDSLAFALGVSKVTPKPQPLHGPALTKRIVLLAAAGWACQRGTGMRGHCRSTTCHPSTALRSDVVLRN